jgi:imidazolonepropionase
MIPAMDRLLIANARVATLRGGSYSLVDRGTVCVENERIAWVRTVDSPGTDGPGERLDAHGALVTPGLIDCHTHLVYGGNRAGDFAKRQAGMTYARIAAEGGGIASTVRATRALGNAELRVSASRRVAALAREGVTTIEVKSGYGLDVENEMRCLRIAMSLAADHPVSIVTTLLAAHAVPPEFAGDADRYVDEVCERMVPRAARERLASAVDAFCETIAFSNAQVRRVFEAARNEGLRVKLHADQLSDGGGAALAAEFRALSADHLEYASERGIEALAAAGSVAVLLPVAFYFLGETRAPPVELLRRHRVAMAVATDCNPGTAPCASLLTAMNMACTLFGLTPEEALAGATCHAARALGLGDRGTIAEGMRADLAVWPVEHPDELAWQVAGLEPSAVVFEGRRVR